MESTATLNTHMANTLRAILTSRNIELRSVQITEKTLVIHGTKTHLPRTRHTLCRSLSLKYIETKQNDDATFSVYFERLKE